MATILVADDDAHIRDVVRYALEKDGHTIITCDDGAGAVAMSGAVDLVVLDVLMPGLDGLSACRQIRAQAAVPIVFLSSRGEVVDRVNGLELGADDYLPKPFSPRELVTRVAAVLRRGKPGPAGAVLVVGGLRLDRDRHEVSVDGALVDLTRAEFAVLEALVAAPGRLLSREQLIRRAFGTGHHITERTIDSHVRRIRGKLRAAGLDPIETVHGLGYKAREAHPPGPP